MSDLHRVAIGRVMAAFSAAGAILALSVYVALGDVGDMYEDWALHNIMGPLGISVLFWLMVGSQPHNRAVWVFGWCGFFQAVNAVGIAFQQWQLGAGGLAGIPRGDATFWQASSTLLSNTAWLPGIAPLVTLGLVWFPDGRPLNRRWAVVSSVVLVALVTATSSLAFDYRWFGSGAYPPDDEGSVIFGIAMSVIGVTVLLSITSLVLRFGRSSQAQRRQIRWVAWAMGITASLWVIASIADDLSGAGSGGEAFKAVSLLTLPLIVGGYGIAIWRHQLFDIDVVISRTILFGMLATFIGAVYVLIVFGIGSVLGDDTNSRLSLAATVVVAFLFQPVRVRAERAANRLVYGTRATPYEVLADLTAQLNDAESTFGLLDRIVENLAKGTSATCATVWRQTDWGFEAVATWPRNETKRSVFELSEDAFPIERAGVSLGAMTVVVDRGDGLSPTETRLIADLAGSASLILDKARLVSALGDQAAQLFESRRRLVDAEAAELRRLERALHDNISQKLLDIRSEMVVASATAVYENDAVVAAQIDALAGQTSEAIDEIRALAQGIYPPLLESDGLVAALHSLGETVPLPVEIRAVGDVRFAIDVEAAAYFCIAEALTNVVKHANASVAVVDIRLEQRTLGFTVSDDGAGFDTGTVGGDSTGLAGLTDRLEAVAGTIEVESNPGGGTHVKGSVSVGVEELMSV